MKRIILFVCIVTSAALISGFTGQEQGPRFSGPGESRPRSVNPGMMQSNDRIWADFAKCKIKTDRDLSLSIIYTPSVKARQGKNVTISGFMMPLESKSKFSHYLLSKSAPTCAYCPPGAPNEVVEVFSRKPTTWKEDLITISGTLILVNDKEKGIFFQMKDVDER